MAETSIYRVPTGMVLLRGEFGAVGEAAAHVAGLDVPEQRRITGGPERALAWMSPDELMLFCAPGAATGLAQALEEKLTGVHHLALDVSAMRVRFRVTGPFVREVLAKLSPADVSPAALPEGEVRRSRLGQVPAAFWASGTDSFDVVCFRSVSDYLEELLAHSAAAGPVGFF
ncbi:sarcosine oxidase subunit gamma [Pseudoroseicyclus tamaricis]|uniref:Sarcosine oxidase subunit gamma n=1 Tax=Pseudoroseicyclus tamaricis TaxID=2705421 RepID=A0A6B2JY34_9RHOB|nr:sarcosine oxidase subunit gamma family protein [Pseudoroseicyclus tamaricis]NDV01519.1 sarcosine oxidase subunit gamma [Pseudoroseicyclus tamaricis]